MRNLDQVKVFLSDKLNEFIEHFPNTKVSYVLDEFDSVFVEVLPNSVYHSNDEYINWENKITDEFLDAFPYLNLAFVSDDAYVKFDKWDFELSGNVYDVPTQSIPYLSFFDNNLVNNFNTILTDDILFTVNNNFQLFDQNISESIKKINLLEPVYKGQVSEATELITKSKDYALAA